MPEATPERLEIAARIRSLRRARDLSLQELAVSAEISPGYLSEVERGYSDMSGQKLAKLAESLGVTVDYLLTGREENKSASTVSIPAGLSEAAKVLNLSFAETVRLLAGKESLVARRSSSTESEWTAVEWKQFYHKVKPYL